MLLDLTYVIENPLIILGTAVSVVIIKFLITTASLMTLKYPIRIIAASGLTLAQIGEFSFVLERAGRSAGISPAGLGEPGVQTFIAVAVLLMIATPFMQHKSSWMGELLSKTFLRHVARASKKEPEEKSEATLEDHVIIVGYGPAGRHLVQVLHETDIPYIVIEMNPDSVEEMHKKDIPAIFGDASRQYILNLAAVKKAKLCVIATNDPGSSPRIIQQARHLNPTLQILVRTRYLNEIERFEKLGADIVVPEEMETTVRLFSHVLGAYRVPQQEIHEHIKTLRAHDYGIVRGSIQEAHLMVLQGLDEEGLHTRAVAVRNDSPAAGKTLQELELRNKFGLTVLAVKRGEQTIGNPSANFQLQPDDRLVLVGNADQFVDCGNLFRESNLL